VLTLILSEPPPLFGVDEYGDAEDAIFGSSIKFDSSTSGPAKGLKSFGKNKICNFDSNNKLLIETNFACSSIQIFVYKIYRRRK